MSNSWIIKKMIFLCNGHDATLVRWALRYLCEAVSREGIQATIVDLSKMDDEDWAIGADVIMVYRCFDLRTINVMRKFRQQGKFIMFFLDDHVYQPNCKYTCDWQPPTMPLSASDCFVSSNAKLLSTMPEKPKILRRSVLDNEAIGVLRQQYRRDKDKFGIGMLGGMGRGKFMEEFVNDVLRELDKIIPFGKRCDFHYFGQKDYQQFRNITIRSHPYFKPENWKGLYENWVSLDMGVVINPLDESDEWCHCKSELKFVESAAMGVPIITSRVFPYTEFLKEGETGFFASTPKEFAEKIILLMMDEGLSRKVSNACNSYMLTHYNVQDNARKFIEDTKDAIQQKIQQQQANHFGWSSIPKRPF